MLRPSNLSITKIINNKCSSYNNSFGRGLVIHARLCSDLRDR
nr:MAG TPA: hypothetical protein [Caudoviricetes sp.]